MKTVNIVKQFTIVVTLGLAFSVHAQLLGGRGTVGGMIGASGAGGFGGTGSLGNVTQITGRGSMTGSANSAGHLVQPENLGKTAIPNADAAGNGAAGLLENVNAATNTARTEGLRKSANANGSGSASLFDGGTAHTAGNAAGNAGASGGGNATLGLGISGGVDAAGSVDQGARNTAQPARQGVHAQAETTRTFAQASGANAKNTVGQMNTTGNARQIAGAARSANVKPQRKANGTAQGSGSSSVSGSVSVGGSATKGE
ncbi:hypothetical protein [Janthinobacterium sp. HLX7-2]|uniref:hypothetical protein n=1 Tax=Janthinobacterium sp. HLX7-2 TaxID=1259331 RepID=UPI003F26F709